jgi:radical SAM protein with 4Fe4S-binding SPASM domain
MTNLVLRVIRNYKGKGNSLFYFVRLHGRGMLGKITFRRGLNALYAVLHWKMGRCVVSSRPFVVRLDPSAVCNLRCPSCCTPTRQFRPGQLRRMTLETFKDIFSKLSEHALRVTFYISGEPMTNPELFEMIKVANENGSYTYFCTNFTLMRERLLEPMFNSGLDRLSVCLDGFSQEAYQKYRINGRVDDLKTGIEMVMRYKRQHGYKRPFFNVFTITFSHVQPEIDQIKNFCKENHVDQLTLRPDESGFDNSHNHKFFPKPYRSCFWPWITANIDADGAVYPCGNSFGNKLSYGNLLRDSMDDIWNGELYVETRKYLSGKSGKKENLDLPCYSCKFFRPPLGKKAATNLDQNHTQY